MAKHEIRIHYVYGFNSSDETDFNYGATGFVIGWGAKNFGFGQLTITGSAQMDDGCPMVPDQIEWYCDSENLDRDFVREVLAKLADTVKLEHEEEKGED